MKGQAVEIFVQMHHHNQKPHAKKVMLQISRLSQSGYASTLSEKQFFYADILYKDKLFSRKTIYNLSGKRQNC